MRVEFAVPGPPRGKERPRVVRRGGRTIAYTPRQTRLYEHEIAVAALRVRPDGWPLDAQYALYVVAVGGRCDGDNCLKACADALEGVLYDNDRRVRHASAERYTLAEEKRRRGKAAEPGTWIACEVLT